LISFCSDWWRTWVGDSFWCKALVAFTEELGSSAWTTDCGAVWLFNGAFFYWICFKEVTGCWEWAYWVLFELSGWLKVEAWWVCFPELSSYFLDISLSFRWASIAFFLASICSCLLITSSCSALLFASTCSAFFLA
jgi:hypothetical protein